MKYFNGFVLVFAYVPMLFGVYGFATGNEWEGLGCFLFGAWMFWYWTK